jgi:hypothetical protein
MLILTDQQVEKLNQILKELEDFIEQQSRYYAFRKYSYPKLKKLFLELRATIFDANLNLNLLLATTLTNLQNLDPDVRKIRLD